MDGRKVMTVLIMPMTVLIMPMRVLIMPMTVTDNADDGTGIGRYGKGTAHA
jgi:hypothetical protein